MGSRHWASGASPCIHGRQRHGGWTNTRCSEPIHAHRGERPWTEWPPEIRDRHPEAMGAAREAQTEEILYYQYLQWIASDQWQAARAAARPVVLFGDLPFVVAIDSADVWAYQHEFRLDLSVGVPPDAFSDEGQDWRLPLYRWDVMRERNDDWQRARARRTAALYAVIASIMSSVSSVRSRGPWMDRRAHSGRRILRSSSDAGQSG